MYFSKMLFYRSVVGLIANENNTYMLDDKDIFETIPLSQVRSGSLLTWVRWYPHFLRTLDLEPTLFRENLIDLIKVSYVNQ